MQLSISMEIVLNVNYKQCCKFQFENGAFKKDDFFPCQIRMLVALSNLNAHNTRNHSTLLLPELNDVQLSNSRQRLIL